MAVAGDNPFLITPPPGLLPAARPHEELPAETDSSTHRLPPPPAASATTAPAFFPTAIGMPPASRRDTGPALLLPDGTRHPLAASLLIGRNPSDSIDWPDAELLAIDDPAKTVSKTHAAIEVAGPEVWVHDLNSTNGVTIERADGEIIRLQPRERVMASVGDLVSLGSLTLRIQ